MTGLLQFLKRGEKIKFRINTKGILFAKIKDRETLLFEVENVSANGFLLKPDLQYYKHEILPEFFEPSGRPKTVTVKFYALTGEEGNVFLEEVKAKAVAVENDNKIAFVAVGKDAKKLRAMYEKVKSLKESLSFSREEEKNENIGNSVINGRLNAIITSLLISFIEEKRETIKQSRMKFGFYILLALLFLVTGILSNITKEALSERNLKRKIELYEAKHNAKVLFLIHRKRNIGLYGIPIYEFLEINDAHRMLREIRKIPVDKNILLIIHSPGGQLLAGMQIAKMLKEWKGRVTVVVPYYAMSAGTLIALSADEIIASKTTAFGPIDPQIMDSQGNGYSSTVDIINACTLKNTGKESLKLEDAILCEKARKAVVQMENFLKEVVLKDKPENIRKNIIKTLLYTKRTHDFPFFAEDLEKIGIKVSTDLDRRKEISEIIEALNLAEK